MSEFSKSLLKSAATDAPEEGARMRALAQVEGALAAKTAVAGATAKGVVAKSTYAIAVAALVAGGAGLGSGYALGRRVTALTPQATQATHVAPESVSEPQEPEIERAPSRSVSSSPLAVASASSRAAVKESDAPSDVCAATAAESTGACSVEGGKTVTFALKSACTSTRADVFWVDPQCHEVFRGSIAPSETFWQDSWEGHVFRLRDHATHRLIREFSPAAVDGAPDRTKIWKGAPTELPLVTVGASQAPIAEGPPAECTHGGGRAAVLHVKNDRSDGPISVALVDFASCQERNPPSFVRPGEKLDLRTSEGHAYRVRDAAGQLLLDIPPTSLDTTTYLTLP